jgi:hypothetical protein
MTARTLEDTCRHDKLGHLGRAGLNVPRMSLHEVRGLAVRGEMDRPVGDDEPLRLHVAARLAFPDGSISGRALRRAGQTGKLVIERIAGKDYTTLSDIRAMRAQSRVVPRPRVSGYEMRVEIRKAASLTTQQLSSSTEAARLVLDALISKTTPTPRSKPT